MRRLQTSTSFLSPFPKEARMSTKKRRKINAIRRELRRPRAWTRWFNEGLLEETPSVSARLCAMLWGQK